MSKAVPAYRNHKSGQAIVQHKSIPTSDHRLYLGKHGSPSSRRKYKQFLERLDALESQEHLPFESGHDRTIGELVAMYMQHCESYYVAKDGRQTSEFSCAREALRPLVAMYGEELGRDFGPRMLATAQQKLIAMNYARSVVNSHMSRVKRMFKWASKHELVTSTIYHGLLCNIAQQN